MGGGVGWDGMGWEREVQRDKLPVHLFLDMSPSPLSVDSSTARFSDGLVSPRGGGGKARGFFSEFDGGIWDGDREIFRGEMERREGNLTAGESLERKMGGWGLPPPLKKKWGGGFLFMDGFFSPFPPPAQTHLFFFRSIQQNSGHSNHSFHPTPSPEPASVDWIPAAAACPNPCTQVHRPSVLRHQSPGDACARAMR